MNNIQTQSKQMTNVSLNKYVLINEIGRGAHGVIYQAHHENKPDEIVAVKVINDTGNLDTLLVEPELLSRLNHPNIINLKDYFIHAGKLILVTEYIDGIDLQSYLEQRGRLTVEEIIAFLTQMANALVHAHANNIIHRDVKLSNILVTGNDKNQRFVLVDFGISRMAEGIQIIKRVSGTYYYMAPEQLRGRPCEQSDLWALGVCAYALLTGIKPFEGDTKEDLSKKILLSIPQVPSEIVEEIPPYLEEIIIHLLEKEFINRTTSANDLLKELKKIPKSTVTEYISDKNSIEEFTSKYPVSTWEQKDLADLKRSWVRLWIFAFIATVPNDILGSAMSLGGLFLFYLGQEKRKILYTTSGILVLFLAILIPFRIGLIIDNRIADIIFGIFFIFALHYLTKIRRLQEKLLLHRRLREASRDSEKIIGMLKKFVDINWENINVRQKYIELLLLKGRVKKAIVEAKLTIKVDPYNFGTTLLLANGYFEAGLYEECIHVCNSYLAVSCYSFEFSDLKGRCERIIEYDCAI